MIYRKGFSLISEPEYQKEVPIWHYDYSPHGGVFCPLGFMEQMDAKSHLSREWTAEEWKQADVCQIVTDAPCEVNQSLIYWKLKPWYGEWSLKKGRDYPGHKFNAPLGDVGRLYASLGPYTEDELRNAGREFRGTRNPSIFTKEEQLSRPPSFSKAVADYTRMCSGFNGYVYDLGCGRGEYTSYLLNLGVTNVLGIDGTPELYSLVNEKWKHHFQRRDISEVFPKGIYTPGTVLCLEVMEHIDPEKESVVLDNINKLCDKHLILSWAYPGQGGLRHVNEQADMYVIDKFQQYGFDFKLKATLELREKAGQEVPWLGKSLYVFERD